MRHSPGGVLACAVLWIGCAGSQVDSSLGDGDHDGWSAPEDCNDRDPSVHPEAEEIPYDGIDQDCLDGDPTDVDADGWLAMEAGGDDCDDADPTVNPVAPEVPYDGVDQDCFRGDVTDVDADGFEAVEAGGDACDDRNARVHPGVVDECGGGDEDCDGTEDEDQDADGDGFSTCGGDCDDDNDAVNPDAYDVGGNDLDEDCSGKKKGNCADELYDASQGTLFWCGSSSGPCDDPNVVGARLSCEGATRVRFWQVPEDADCDGGVATWDGFVTADSGEQADGHFVVPLDGSCGGWRGRLYLAPHWCENATGSMELSNITTFINECN